MSREPETTEKKPPHPLVMDSETKLFRWATHEDILRWERMEVRYRNLLTMLKEAADYAEGALNV